MVLRSLACAHCGGQLSILAHLNRKYCSPACRHAAAWQRSRPLPRAMQVRICDRCGARFETHQKHARFCSRQCRRSGENARRAANAPPMHECAHCGQGFSPRRKEYSTYCSRECSFAAKRAKLLGKRSEQAAERAFRHLVRWDDRQDRLDLRKVLAIKKCVCCGEDFDQRLRKSQRTCSETCRARLYAETVRRHRPAHRKARRLKYGKGWRKRCRVLGVPYEPVNVVAVFERDRWQCQICRCKTPRRLKGKVHDRAPTIDHRVALTNGGGHIYENVQCACRRCNVLKRDGPPVGQMPLWPRMEAQTHA